MPITAIVGEQRGDEGKGRFVDEFMPDFDIGARFNGGDNAGHTVVTPDGQEYDLHSLPTAILHPRKKSVMGGGVVLHPVRLVQEMETLAAHDVEINDANLLIDGGAHLILPHHVLDDKHREKGRHAQGSTHKGIAQAYADKAARVGVRAEIINNNPDRLFELAYLGLRRHRKALGQKPGYGERKDRSDSREYVECARRLGKFVTDTSLFLNKELRADRPANILAEGAQASLLDIDTGMYPYVTSSSTTSGGVAIGLGVPGKFIERVLGVSKAVQSHVGGGPFVTEIHDEKVLGQLHGDMDSVDAECGTTTGRTRRLGYLDLPQIRRAQMINGTDEMALTKLDWVPRFGKYVLICEAYRRKGNLLPIAPNAGYKLQQSVPLYEKLPTWDEDIQDVKNFEDLPVNAQNYITHIEATTKVPITRIGVGPRRDQVIVRQPAT